MENNYSHCYILLQLYILLAVHTVRDIEGVCCGDDEVMKGINYAYIGQCWRGW